jgi:protein-S-isoprenylcysteine O-methyltransferase Ste14
MKKFFDLRFVIGLFFLVVGALLFLYSFISSLAEASIINRWCGGIFIVFSIVMILLSLWSHDTEN